MEEVEEAEEVMEDYADQRADAMRSHGRSMHPGSLGTRLI
jgi:hypothetical protein